MSRFTALSEAGFSGATPMILTRVARQHIDALGREDAPTRLLIVGTAGSGKTRLLRRLVTQLEDAGYSIVSAATAGDVSAADPDEIVLVDDAHLLDEATIAAVTDRMRVPGAGVIATTRPWPSPDAVQRLCHDLEQARPPIVLGHVTRTDIVAQLEEDARHIDPRCIDSILGLTGQLTWLVSEAIAIHADGRCDDDADHTVLREELRDVIAHRVASIDADLRSAVETLCLSPLSLPAEDAASWSLAGHAKGLLQRNGQPAPVVRDTVRATTPIDRLVQMYATGAADVAPDPIVRELVGDFRDPRVATALLMEGDAALTRDPHRAAELFRAAGESGAEPLNAAVRHAGAQWAAGDIDTAEALLDAAPIDPGHASYPAAIALAGAVWAAR